MVRGLGGGRAGREERGRLGLRRCRSETLGGQRQANAAQAPLGLQALSCAPSTAFCGCCRGSPVSSSTCVLIRSVCLHLPCLLRRLCNTMPTCAQYLTLRTPLAPQEQRAPREQRAREAISALMGAPGAGSSAHQHHHHAAARAAAHGGAGAHAGAHHGAGGYVPGAQCGWASAGRSGNAAGLRVSVVAGHASK